MNQNCGYKLEREFVDVLLDKNPLISQDQIREAGGGMLALVLSVESARRIRLYRLAKELKFQARHSAAQVVAVSMPAGDGRTWEVVPLSYLQGLADEAVALKDQTRLEAALRPRV